MLPDTNDDLLSQLSCELGLSDFMDQGSSILEDGRSNNLYDQFLASVENEEHNTLFNELIESDGKWPFRNDVTQIYVTPLIFPKM